jgi:hypothetical protein
MIGSVNKRFVRSLCYSVSNFLFALLVIISGLPDLSAQTGFYRVHPDDSNTTVYQTLQLGEQFFLISSTICEVFRECSILSKVDESGEIIWSVDIPEIDVATGSSLIMNDTIFIMGNNHPQNNKFLIAWYDLDGNRLGLKEVFHPEIQLTSIFIISSTVFNNQILMSGQGRRNDSTYNLVYVLDQNFELDTLIIPTKTRFINSPRGFFVSKDGLLTIMIALSYEGLPSNWREIHQYDKDFNLVWRYETEKTTGDRVIPVGCELPDGRLIMACRHEGTDYIASVCCINKDSTLSWRFDHPLHGSRGRRIYRIKPLPNGDIIGCGHYTELQFSEHRLSTTPFLFKISAEGNLLWERV